MTGQNPSSRTRGMNEASMSGLGHQDRARFYAEGARPALARLDGALGEVQQCAKLGLVRSADIARLREVADSIPSLVEECERAVGGWGG